MAPCLRQDPCPRAAGLTRRHQDTELRNLSQSEPFASLVNARNTSGSRQFHQPCRSSSALCVLAPSCGPTAINCCAPSHHKNPQHRIPPTKRQIKQQSSVSWRLRVRTTAHQLLRAEPSQKTSAQNPTNQTADQAAAKLRVLVPSCETNSASIAPRRTITKPSAQTPSTKLQIQAARSCASDLASVNG